MIKKGKDYSIFELRAAYLSKDEEIRKSLFKYEQWLHNEKIMIDKYDRSNLEAASKGHLMSIINGFLFQLIWFEESERFYNLEPIQDVEKIDTKITFIEKNYPDFIDKTTKETIELKYSKSGKYVFKDWKLYNNNGELITPSKMHNADIVIVVLEFDGRMIEAYCKRFTNNYNIKYITSNKRVKRIQELFDTLKV